MRDAVDEFRVKTLELKVAALEAQTLEQKVVALEVQINALLRSPVEVVLFERVTKLEAQMEALGNDLIPPLVTSMAAVPGNLRDHKRQVEQVLRDSEDRWSGLGFRIDQMTGTLADLQMRFEAWKSVGNQMGETVNLMKEAVNSQGELMTLHQDHLVKQRAFNNEFTSFAATTRELLGAIRAAIGVAEPSTTAH